MALVVSVVAAVAAVSAINVIDVFFIRDTLHASTTAYGLLGALWTGAVLIGSWLAAAATRSGADAALVSRMLVLIGGISTVVLVAAAVPNVWWLVPLWIVGGTLNGGVNVIAGVVVARRVPSEVRGRALGTFVGAVNGATVLGLVAGGALLGAFSPPVLIAACGVAGLLVVAACTLTVARTAREPRPVVSSR
jgi:MFS family permease